MSNHNPTITSSNATGSFSENANTTGSTALHDLSGTMNFTDSDHGDTHTTSASLKSAVLSSGSVIPATTLADLSSAMSSSILSDSNGSGTLAWSFSAEDDDFDFLAKNQSLTLTYEIQLSDNHGGTTKKLVTVTITGTDDKPVIDFGTQAIVSEQTGQSLSLSPDTAHIAVHFTDVDLTNTGHTATLTGVSATGATDGLLPGFLGEAELMSFFHIDNVVKASGSSDGTINTTFSAPDLAFDYLSAGETVDITYTIRLDDHAGGITNQTVVVTVVGTNDGPAYLSCPDTEHLTEGQDLSPAGELTAGGDLLFADIDLSDTHTVSTTVTATRSGGGAVPLTEAELLAALTTGLEDSTGHALGEVDWAFALANGDVSFLNTGETLTITYDITVTDDAGASTTQTVSIEILGTNDPVVVTSGPELASLAEFADTTGSATQNTTTPVPTGALAFTDTDLGDTHTVAVAVDSAAWSAGGSVPGVTLTDLGTALLTTLNDSTGTGTGSVDWTFSITDQDLDFLAAGETLTVVYDVAVSDGPTQSTQTVTVTVDGANDAVAVSGPAGSVSITEFAGMHGASAPNPAIPATGTMAFADVDLSDTHTVQANIASIVFSGGPDIPPDTFADLMSALQTTLSDSTGTGAGSVDWSFSIPDRDLDFLADGETLIVTYDVIVSDGATSSSQTVTVTATGAPDDLTVNPATGSILDTAATDTGSIVAFGNVITDALDSGGDLGTTLSVTAVNGSAANVDNFVTGTFGDLIIFADGSYFYLANSSLDPLMAGDSATEIFNFTVTDSIGRHEDTTLTLDVFGADDAPAITAATAFGSLTEDTGPSSIVNGSFETGDFTGWLASGATSVQFLALGDEFGNYSVVLGPTVGTLTQDIATVPGAHYTLSFVVTGDPESSSNSFTASWDGTPVLSNVDNFGGYTTYTFDVVATDSNSTLQFSYSDDGTGMILDQVFVASVAGPPTETVDGSISFTDIETGDTHTASFLPVGGDYLGTFSLGPVSESGGSGSVDWHFTVDNADIQYLGEGDSITQNYFVLITGEGGVGASVAQSVAVTIHGTNDAPTTVGNDTVITNADVNGVFIPAWALTINDIDPDTSDTLSINSITGQTGGAASPFLFGDGVIAFDDATLGQSFTYDTTDGTAVSAGSGTVTIVNNPSTTTTLNGTGGDDIIIATVGGEALNGGGGDDILIGNSGSHVLTGGGGDDIFAFQLVPATTDTNAISDFDNVSDHDMIAISAAAFGGGLTPGVDVSSVFESSSDAEFFSGTALFHYDTTDDTLYYSSDGTTASALVVAQLQSGVLLNAHDMMIV